MLHMLRVDVII